MTQKTVIVGMSGGVDSSVTAWLLKEQGYRVIGIFMKNWEDEEECPAVQDYQDVISVCSQLQIPYYSLNFSKEYWERVFAHCLREYEAGFTPNPDILCNREIKFKLFLEKSLALGADFVATGHYCGKVQIDGEWALTRGADEEKDQSYFLYTLKSEILRKVLFPLSALTKKEVRQIAEKAGLTTAKKKDSTGICFIGKRDFREFLSRYIPQSKGSFERLSGEYVGEHVGAHHYTIGQRRGLNIGGQGEAWYVVGKDMKRNVVFVEQGDDHSALYSTKLCATEASWVRSTPSFPFKCTAKIRYRALDASCTVDSKGNGELLVHFEEPQKAITERQSIVFYQDQICLGGAFIQTGFG